VVVMVRAFVPTHAFQLSVVLTYIGLGIQQLIRLLIVYLNIIVASFALHLPVG